MPDVLAELNFDIVTPLDRKVARYRSENEKKVRYVYFHESLNEIELAYLKLQNSSCPSIPGWDGFLAGQPSAKYVQW